MSFEKILYELNAKIRQESRKNSKFQETIPKMIEQFKIDNPLIIEKLSVERNILDTNSNINSTMSSEAITTNSLRTNTGKYVENNKNNNKNSHNAVETSDSTTGYSNSTQENFTTNRALYASVKSSTELLNTMKNSKKFDGINNENLDEKLKTFQKIQTMYIDNDMNKSLMMNDNDHNLKTSDVNNNNSNIRNNDPEYNDKDEIIESDEINESDESDIASALTQILEETSDASMDSDSKMSVDEELMIETVQEINEDLNKLNVDIENIILTPPLEFRN